MRILKIFEDVRPELTGFLRTIILSQVDATKRSSRNVGGWKSKYDFFDWPSHTVGALYLELQARLGGNPIGWAMVNRLGSCHPPHEHDASFTCGVYYVSPGDPAVPTIFEDTSSGVRIDRYVEPKPGRLVIFPGSMTHSVPVYNGKEPRISVAFEIRPKP